MLLGIVSFQEDGECKEKIMISDRATTMREEKLEAGMSRRSFHRLSTALHLTWMEFGNQEP